MLVTGSAAKQVWKEKLALKVGATASLRSFDVKRQMSPLLPKGLRVGLAPPSTRSLPFSSEGPWPGPSAVKVTKRGAAGGGEGTVPV